MKKWYRRSAGLFLAAVMVMSTFTMHTFAEDMADYIPETGANETTEKSVEMTRESLDLVITEDTQGETETELTETEIESVEFIESTETTENNLNIPTVEDNAQKSIELSAVTNLSASASGERSVTLQWNAVLGAEGYLVYRQVGKSGFQLYAVVNETSYVDLSASETEYNFYRVYPYYMDGSVEIKGPSNTYVYAKGVVNEKLPAVTNLKAAASGSGRVSLQWDAVSGAEGYLVYRQIGSGGKFEYRYIVSKTNFVDTTASKTEYNFYRIYPYYKDEDKIIAGISDKYVYATGVLPRELISVKNLEARGTGKGRVSLKCDAVPGAEGYLIYRQIGKTSFQYRYMVTQTSFTDTTASQNEYNFFRVYPFYRNDFVRVDGPSTTYTYAKGVMPLIAVKNLTATGIKRGQVDLKWDAVPGAEGYLIYRQVGNGSFKYLYMVDRTDYNDITASQSEYNFYRVYPYFSFGNQKIVGPSDTYVYAKGVFAQGWYWINGYKRYLDEDGIIDNDVSRLVSGPYLIKVYKWSNYLIVFAKDEWGNYTVPVKAMITSCGNGTPTGTYYSPMKFRWLTMVGGSQAQWCTQITGDYLFHSVPYRIADPTTLYTDLMYNWLGTTQSLGCIRLQAGDAKWIYDNCELGTEIYITPWEDGGPIPKPEFVPIPSWHTWDPTDPNTRYLCEQYGCH